MPPPNLNLTRERLASAVSQAQANINIEATHSRNPPENLAFTHNQDQDYVSDDNEDNNWSNTNVTSGTL